MCWQVASYREVQSAYVVGLLSVFRAAVREVSRCIIIAGRHFLAAENRLSNATATILDLPSP